MKKTLLIIISICFNINLYSQTDDLSYLTLDTSKVYSVNEEIQQIYQYRIILNKNYDNFNDVNLIQSMIDLFETNVDYNKDLNQFTLISKKNIEQSKFINDFNQQILMYKKIALIRKID